MINLLNMIPTSPEPFAFLSLDLDTNAERVVIQDRYTLEVFAHYLAKPTLKIRVPLRYSVDDALLITLIDDSRTFDAKSVDFVRAEINEQN